MSHSNISHNIINEDFFDEIKADEIIDSDVEKSPSQKNFNHNVKIHTSGIEIADSPKVIQSLLVNYIKKLSIVLNAIKSVNDFSEPRFCILNTKEQQIVFFGLEDIPEMYKKNIFRLSTVMIYIDIQCDFKSIRDLNKFLHSILISIESRYKNSRLCVMSIDIDHPLGFQQQHYIDTFSYRKKKGDNFIKKMTSVISALIPSEYKPMEQMFKFYHIGCYDKIVEMIRGRYGKSVLVADLNIPPYPVDDIISNTTRLYKPGFIDSKNGTMEFHRDTNEVYYDFMSPEKDGDKICEICNNAISQMIKENSKYQIHLIHGNGGPGAILFIFENTYSYKDVEYIVTVSYEFEAPIASYTIAQSDMEKIRTELIDEMGYSEEQVKKWFMSVNMHDEYFFKK